MVGEAEAREGSQKATAHQRSGSPAPVCLDEKAVGSAEESRSIAFSQLQSHRRSGVSTVRIWYPLGQAPPASPALAGAGGTSYGHVGEYVLRYGGHEYDSKAIAAGGCRVFLLLL
jgi:hypothetical protein